MNKWMIAFFMSLILLVITNLYWVYAAIDSGVTQTYQDAARDDQEHIINALGDLIIKGARDYSQKDVLHLLRKAKPEALIVEEKDKIIFERTVFQFKDDHLIKVFPH